MKLHETIDRLLQESVQVEEQRDRPIIEDRRLRHCLTTFRDLTDDQEIVDVFPLGERVVTQVVFLTQDHLVNVVTEKITRHVLKDFEQVEVHIIETVRGGRKGSLSVAINPHKNRDHRGVFEWESIESATDYDTLKRLAHALLKDSDLS